MNAQDEKLKKINFMEEREREREYSTIFPHHPEEELLEPNSENDFFPWAFFIPCVSHPRFLKHLPLGEVRDKRRQRSSDRHNYLSNLLLG